MLVPTSPIDCYARPTPLAGNHDADDVKYTDTISSPLSLSNDAGGECAIPYRAIFQMPQPAGPKYDFYR